MTPVEMIDRTRCVIANCPDLEPLHTFSSFPVYMGATDKPAEKDLRADMNWAISSSSGVIQLTNLLPLEVLYPESHGSGLVGETWRKHHESLARFIHTFSPKAVFEIGGAHGLLSREFSALSETDWTILEPNPTPADGVTATYVKGFFSSDFQFGGPLDVVVHSHFFEHLYEPDMFLSHLAGFMKPGKRLIFSVPQLEEMLKRKYCNSINFEHTFFFTEPLLEYLLAKHGFRVIEKEYYLDDHSVFYAAERDPFVETKPLPEGLVERHKKIFEDYLSYYEKLIGKFNDQIHASKEPVYLFGGHVFSQYLIAFGLDQSGIECIIDNDLNKHEKRLYGGELIIHSPKILANKGPVSVILKAGAYDQEIKDDILSNINSEVSFWS